MFTSLTPESLTAFLELLKNFDSHYSYSDDIRVYRAGKAREEQIKKICLNKDFMDVKTTVDWYSGVENTTENTILFKDTLDAIVAKAAKPAVIAAQNVNPPAEVRVKPVDTKLRFATLNGTTQFTSAKEFLKDPMAAKLYLAKRVSDSVKLFEEIKWVSTDLQGVVTWNYNGTAVSKDIVFGNPLFNTIESESGKLSYHEEVCMLAYMLAKFW